MSYRLFHTKRFIVIAALFLFVAIAIQWSCFVRDNKAGTALSKKYCGSCHMYPSPQLLPKNIWENNILPAMGVFGNFYRDRQGEYHEMTPEMIAAKDSAAGHISFSIPKEDWKLIVQFYLETAPSSLPQIKHDIMELLPDFEYKVPEKSTHPYTSAVYINEPFSQIFQAGMKDGMLEVFDEWLKPAGVLQQTNGIVDIADVSGKEEPGTKFLLTHIGSFGPSPEKKGYVEEVVFKNGVFSERKKLIDNLDRPVQSIMADVDKDGLQDIVVCEFGFLQGALKLYKNTGHGYDCKLLSRLAGPIKMYEDDINQDGLPDFWVLFAAGYEGIVQFVNIGDGNFGQSSVLGFPPAFGSTYFELVDFNNDGKKDIIYTCGDNADHSPVLKPYHGVYLFENMGKLFEKKYFYPLHGCYKASMKDFDEDGDLDIATISFFPDFEKHAEEGFVFLRNNGNYNYTPQTFSGAAGGRWACMDAKDIDNDGDIDIVLGNLAAKPDTETHVMNNWLKNPAVIVLINKLRRK